MAENFDRADRPERPEQEMDFADEGFGDKAPRRYQRRRPRQVVPDYVDWKDVDLLRQFIPERGKIMPRRISGITAKDQRRIATAIKRARTMALLPFVFD
jgi:small subunit ribosomal protein S18